MARKILRGEVIAPGMTSGILCIIDAEMEPTLNGDKRKVQDEDLEIEQLEQEVDAVIEDLKEAVDLLHLQAYYEEAEIVQTHIFMLKDEEFHRRIHEQIKVNGIAAERALEHVLQEMVDMFERSDNIFFSERSTDVKDIVLRLKRKLAKKDNAIFEDALEGITSPVVYLKVSLM
jgi:phosphotransferase system enzyme I (PtsI)